MVLAESKQLILSDLRIKSLGHLAHLFKPFAGTVGWSSNNSSSAGHTTRDTLGHTDEVHGSQVSSLRLDLLHAFRSRSEGGVNEQDNLLFGFDLIFLAHVSQDFDVRNLHVRVGRDLNKEHGHGHLALGFG